MRFFALCTKTHSAQNSFKNNGELSAVWDVTKHIVTDTGTVPDHACPANSTKNGSSASLNLQVAFVCVCVCSVATLRLDPESDCQCHWQLTPGFNFKMTLKFNLK